MSQPASPSTNTPSVGEYRRALELCLEALQAGKQDMILDRLKCAKATITAVAQLLEKPQEHQATVTQLREELLKEIRAHLPKEQTYVDIHLPKCAGIKYLDANGICGTYQPAVNQINPYSVDDLPLDVLPQLLKELKDRGPRKTA